MNSDSLRIAVALAAALGCLACEDSGSAAPAASDAAANPDSAGAPDTSIAQDASAEDTTPTDSRSVTYRGEVWADNWSAMYVGDTLVMEDSVSIDTERSFNAEVFTFEATPPFVLNVVMKDYIANNSGLEYIGQPNQQMGDGGYIAQITDEMSGVVVAASSAEWRCLTIHTAPLDKACEDAADPLTACTWSVAEEPAGWKAEAFDDSAWVAATVYSAEAVGPKDGYDEITWDPTASLIWGADLETHNTILCRVRVSR